MKILTYGDARAGVTDALDSGDGIIYAYRLPVLREVPIELGVDLAIGGWIARGWLRLTVNSREIMAKEGDSFLLQPGDVIDKVTPSPDIDGCSFVVESKKMLELVNEVQLYRYMMYLKEHPVVTPSDSSRDFIASCIRMISEKLQNEDNKWIKPKTSAIHLIHALVVEVFEVLNTMELKVYESSHTVFQRFTELLNTTSVHSHSVEWYASQLNVTAKYLSEICRRSSGRPASAWIQDYCMIEIRRNLSDPSLSIKEVSAKLGYANLSFFGKCVRRWFGMSPTPLREKLLGNSAEQFY